MSSDKVWIRAEWRRIKARGDFRDRRVVVSDPDDVTGRTRNIYEDLDQETPSSDRMCCVIIEPQNSKQRSRGNDDDDFIELISHEKAIEDINRMIRLGFEITVIERDRPERMERD